MCVPFSNTGPKIQTGTTNWQTKRGRTPSSIQEEGQVNKTQVKLIRAQQTIRTGRKRTKTGNKKTTFKIKQEVTIRNRLVYRFGELQVKTGLNWCIQQDTNTTTLLQNVGMTSRILSAAQHPVRRRITLVRTTSRLEASSKTHTHTLI